MKQPVQPISEKVLRRDYPIEGLVPGWFFCQREVSAGCYIVAGRDIYGREVSAQSTNPDTALQECAQFARRVSNPIATPICLFRVTGAFDIAGRGCMVLVLDLHGRKVHGHRLLNLNREYGLEQPELG
jgi:hypothetical protein